MHDTDITSCLCISLIISLVCLPWEEGNVGFDAFELLLAKVVFQVI